MTVIRAAWLAGVVATVIALLAGCEDKPAPDPAPLHKGDPGVPDQHYPTEMAPDPRTNGRWMVKGINTDAANMRSVPITPAQYEEFMAIQDTGSIPCPEVPR